MLPLKREVQITLWEKDLAVHVRFVSRRAIQENFVNNLGINHFMGLFMIILDLGNMWYKTARLPPRK
jgi:hypothetical protein